jgi:glutathione S-transferase
VHIRRYFYHTLLEHPAMLIPMFTHNGPWYGPLLSRMMFPALRKRMRDLMKINEHTAQTSRHHVERAIDRLHAHLRDRDYLVGDRFTRADLTAAALLAPLCRPPQYGLPWPRPFPEAIESMVESNFDKTRWVDEFYRRHRP